MTHLTPFAVCQRCHGDRRKRGHQVDFQHSAVHDNENADAQRPHGDAHEQALEPQPEQRADVHLHEAALQIGDDAADVDGGIADDNAGCAVYHALRYVEYAHDDIPGIGDDENGGSRLENPLEEHPCVEIVEVVFIGDELDQLQSCDESENQPGNRQDDVIRQGVNHVVDAAVPRLRRRTHLTGDLTDFLVDVIEHTGEITDDAADEYLPQPFDNRLFYHVHWRRIPPFPRPPARGGRARRDLVVVCGVAREKSAEQTGEQRHEGDADERHAASHELLHALGLY